MSRSARCVGRLTLRAGKKRYGGARFSIRAKGTGKVRVHVGHKVLKLVRRHHGRLRVGATVVVRRSTGASTSTGTLVLTSHR